jgi:hypothetical protein
MPVRRTKELPSNVLQEYFESLSDLARYPDRKMEKVLESYSELLYRLNGGGKCSVCRAAVRHVIEVRVERTDGSVHNYECLCTRCLEAERAVSECVVLTIGKAVLEYPCGKGSPKTQKFRASAL